MECPNCGNEVPFYAETCAVCHADLSLLQTVDWIKRDLVGAKTHSEGLAGKLAEVEKRIGILEKEVTSQCRPVIGSQEPPATPVALATKPPGPVTSVPESSVGGEGPSTPPPPAEVPLAPARQPGPEIARLKTFAQTRDKPLDSPITELQLGQMGLLIAGLAVVVLGIGYFLKYSFDNNWITPLGRVAISYGVGVTCLALGGWFTRKLQMRVFGLCLFGGGIATLYFATFAAHQMYDLIGSQVAMGLMAMVTMGACALAVRHDTQWLAVLGLIGGFVTPFVLDSPHADPFVLLGYIAILNAGVLTIAAFKGWELLNNLGFFFTWLIFSICYGDIRASEAFWKTTLFLQLFMLTYAVVPFARHLATGAPARFREYALTFPNLVIGLLFSADLITGHFESRRPLSWVTLCYGFLFLAMAYRIHQKNAENRLPVHVLIGQAVSLFTLTIPLLFTGVWITLFGLVEAVVLLEISSRLKEKFFLQAAFGLLILAIGKFVVNDLAINHGLVDGIYYSQGFFADCASRWTNYAGVLAATSLFGWRLRESPLLPETNRNLVSGQIFTVALVEGFILANLEVAAFLHDFLPDARSTGLSVLWAVFSIGLMVAGFVLRKKEVRVTALGLFAVTLGKVFLIDMAEVSTPYRILSMIVLGMLMVISSYFYHRYAGRILGDEREAHADVESKAESV